jgi:hypothetical protein
LEDLFIFLPTVQCCFKTISQLERAYAFTVFVEIGGRVKIIAVAYCTVYQFVMYIKEKHAGFKMNPRVKLHFINKLKTK